MIPFVKGCSLPIAVEPGEGCLRNRTVTTIARRARFCVGNGGIMSRSIPPGVRSPGKAGTFLKRWLNALVLLCSSCS